MYDEKSSEEGCQNGELTVPDDDLEEEVLYRINRNGYGSTAIFGRHDRNGFFDIDCRQFSS